MTATKTSKAPHKLVFFKKEDCGPCKQALANLEVVLERHPELAYIVTVMQKEYHSALVAAYELNLYPTVLIMDEKSDELARKVGVRFLTIEWWEAALTAIHLRRTKENK